MAVINLFSGATADGTSSAVRVTPMAGQAQLESVLAQVTGTFGGGSVKFQTSANGDDSPATWADLLNTAGDGALSQSVAGASVLNVPAGTWLRAVISGSTAPSLTAALLGDIERA